MASKKTVNQPSRTVASNKEDDNLLPKVHRVTSRFEVGQFPPRQLLVSDRSTCRVCGGKIVRSRGLPSDVWLHVAFLEGGETFSHQARQASAARRRTSSTEKRPRNSLGRAAR